MVGGGWGLKRWLPKPFPPSPVGRIMPWIGRIDISHHVAGAAGDAKCLPRSCEVSANNPPRVTCGAGWENAISSYTLQLMVISRNLFYKSGVQKTFFYLTSMSKSASLFSMSCEKWISCLYSGVFIYKQGGRLFGLSWRRFILQATSLQRTVNIKNKASHNSTRGTVSFMFFSRWKVLLHSVR